MKVHMYWERDDALYITKEQDLDGEDYTLTEVPRWLFRCFRIAESLYWKLTEKLAKCKPGISY